MPNSGIPNGISVLRYHHRPDDGHVWELYPDGALLRDGKHVQWVRRDLSQFVADVRRWCRVLPS